MTFSDYFPNNFINQANSAVRHPVILGATLGAVAGMGIQKYLSSSHKDKKVKSMLPAPKQFSILANNHPLRYAAFFGSSIGGVFGSMVTYAPQISALAIANWPYISKTTSDLFSNPMTYYLAGFATIGIGVGYVRAKGMKESYKLLKQTYSNVYEGTYQAVSTHYYKSWAIGFAMVGVLVDRLYTYSPSRETVYKFLSSTLQSTSLNGANFFQSCHSILTSVDPKTYWMTLYGIGAIAATYGVYRAAPYIYYGIKKHPIMAVGGAISLAAIGIHNALPYVPESLWLYAAQTRTMLGKTINTSLVPTLSASTYIGLAGAVLCGFALYKYIPYFKRTVAPEAEEQGLNEQQIQLRSLSKMLLLLSQSNYESFLNTFFAEKGVQPAMDALLHSVTDVTSKAFKAGLELQDLENIKALPLHLIDITKVVTEPTGRDERASKMNVLHLAIMKGDLIFAQRVCKIAKDFTKTDAELKTFINAADSRGLTPLHYAATNGEIDQVKFLLECGANPLAKDDRNLTPVAHVIDEPALTKFLINAMIEASIPSSARESVHEQMVEETKTNLVKELRPKIEAELRLQIEEELRAKHVADSQNLAPLPAQLPKPRFSLENLTGIVNGWLNRFAVDPLPEIRQVEIQL